MCVPILTVSAPTENFSFYLLAWPHCISSRVSPTGEKRVLCKITIKILPKILRKTFEKILSKIRSKNLGKILSKILNI